MAFPFLSATRLACALAAAAAFAATAPLCADDAPADAEAAKAVDGIAAIVNGEAITVSEALQLARDTLHARNRGRDTIPDPAEIKAAYDEALEQLVDRCLILEEYRRSDAKMPSWIVDSRIQEIVATRYRGDRSRMIRELALRRISFDSFRNQIEDQYKMMAMRHLNVGADVVVRPADVRAYYDAHRDDFVSAPAYDVRMFRLPRELAEEGKTALVADAAAVNSPEAFAALAAKYGNGRVDDLGWQIADDLSEKVLGAVRAAGGNRAEVVAMGSATYVVFCAGVRAGSELSFAEVSDLIRRKLADEEADRRFRNWTALLRSRARIQYFHRDGGKAE